MKSVVEHIDSASRAIPRMRVMSQAQQNMVIMNNPSQYHEIVMMQCENLSEALQIAFDWTLSPQGHDYWLAVWQILVFIEAKNQIVE
jgi:hypothetical protein